MARKLILMTTISIDGYFEGPDHDLSWHNVSDELHAYFNEQLRGMSAFVEGRVTYRGMEEYWPTADQDPAVQGPMREFASIWRETPKIVYSRTMREEDLGPNATLRREIDPAEIAGLKAQPGGDLALGGSLLAADFARLGLIDEYWLFLSPIILGEGRPLFAPGAPRQPLELIDTRAFSNSVLLLRYAVGSSRSAD